MSLRNDLAREFGAVKIYSRTRYAPYKVTFDIFFTIIEKEQYEKLLENKSYFENNFTYFSVEKYKNNRVHICAQR